MATVVDSLLISIGIDPQGAKEGFAAITQGARQTDAEFEQLSNKWAGTIKGLISTVIAPVAGAFAIGKVVNSYMSDISEVATLTGAYSQKLEEWRIKRAQLARVTKEDIELYKKGREAVVGFNIAMADLSAKIMRSFTPVMKVMIDGLNNFTKWLDRNGDNITRFLLTVAGILTTVFLPSILKTSAALLASPLTWIVAALGAVALVVDDLVTYLQGGQTALGSFWAMFGTGEEILAALTNTFNVLKRVVELLWKPIAAVAAGFAAFKTAQVLVTGLAAAVSMVQKAMLLLAANPILVMLTALVGLIMWVADAFKRAGGDWGGVWDILVQDVKDFLGLFSGLGDALLGAVDIILAPLQALGGAISDACSWVVDGTVAIAQGAMTAVSDFTGSVVDGVTSAAQSVASGAQSMWQGLKDGASSAFATVSGAVSGAVDSIRSGFPGAVDTAKQALNSVVDLGGKVAQAIASGASAGEIFDLIKQGALDTLNIFGGLGDKIVSAFDTVREFAADLWAQFAELFPNLAATIEEFAGTAFDALLSAPRAIFNAYATAFGAIADTAVALWEGLVSGVTTAVDTVTTIVTTVGEYVRTAFDATVAAVKSVVSAIAGAISAAIDAVVGFITAYYQTLWSIITAVVDAYVSAVTTVVGWVQKAAAAVGSALSSAASAVIGWVQAALTAVTSAITGAVNAVTSFVTSALQTAANIASSVVSAVASGFAALFDAVQSVISGAFAALRAAVGRVYDAVVAAVDSVRSTISGAFAAAWDTAVRLVGSAVDAIGAAVSSAIDFVKGVFASIVGAVQRAWDSVVSTIAGALDAALGLIPRFVDAVLSFFSEIPSYLAQVFDVSGLIEKAVSSITGAVGSAWNKLKGIFGGDDDEEDKEPKARTRSEPQPAAAPAAQPAAPRAPLGTVLLAPMAQGMANLNAAYAQTPVTASTQNIVNNSYRSERRDDNRQRTNNTTININANGDPKDIARAVQRVLPPNTQQHNNYVAASENGVWAM